MDWNPWNLNAIDAVLLALLLLSALVGLVRGFVFEVMSLLGWIAAYFAARWFAADVAPHIPLGRPGGSLNHMVAFAAVFVVALIAWALLTRLVRLLVHATPLSAVDRLLGAVFGALRGLLLLLAIATAVAWTPWARSPAWQQSQVGAWLRQTLTAVQPLFPPAMARYFSG